jgi:hypothetical protein
MKEYGFVIILIWGIILRIIITRFIIWLNIKCNESKILKETKINNTDDLSTVWEDDIIRDLLNRGIQEANIAF